MEVFHLLYVMQRGTFWSAPARDAALQKVGTGKGSGVPNGASQFRDAGTGRAAYEAVPVWAHTWDKGDSFEVAVSRVWYVGHKPASLRAWSSEIAVHWVGIGKQEHTTKGMGVVFGWAGRAYQ